MGRRNRSVTHADTHHTRDLQQVSAMATAATDEAGGTAPVAASIDKTSTTTWLCDSVCGLPVSTKNADCIAAINQ